MSATAQAKFNDTLARLDAVLEQRTRREEQEQARADADLETARRARMRANAEACREIQALYSDAFRSFNVEVPMPVDGQAPAAFRKMLFNRIVRKLPEANEWAGTRADDIPLGPAMDNIEALVLEAAKVEGEKPSFDNLPDTGMVMRVRTDANTGTKYNEFFGRESFVKSMGREGRKVLHIKNPQTGSVLWGKPIETAPTFRR
jgi:hypothetical protein